jgi:GT2 family glycosyltransferase
MAADITIAIFVHNAVDYLKTTIYSLEKNTGYAYQLLIIDDASDGPTKAYLQGLRKGTLITNNRQMGFPHNANLTIDHSDTRYIMLLNSDVYVTQGWLSLIVDCLKDKQAHGIAGPSTSWARGEQRIVHRPNWTYEQIEDFGAQTYRKYEKKIQYLDQLHSVCGFCYAFKRELVEQIGYFDEVYGLGQWEETDYNTRAAMAGYKRAWVCGAYVHHYGGKSFPTPTAIALLQRNRGIYHNKFRSFQINKLSAEDHDHCLTPERQYFTRAADLRKVCRQPPEYTIKYCAQAPQR